MAWLLACIQPPDPSTWTGLPAGDGWPDEAGEPIPAPGGLDAPWLEDVAAYGRDELPSGRADAGSFGVGNGQVFGMIGLDDPVNTLTNAIGPGYDADAGFFGDSAFLLDTEVTDARVQRVRGTAIVRTWEAGDGAELSTTSFAAPDDPVLVRLVTVSATRAGAVRWSIARADDEDPSTDELTQTRGSRRTRLTCETGSLIDDGWEIPFEAGEATIRCEQAFADGDFTSTTATVDDARAAASDALAGAMTLEAPDPKVIDLYEGMLITEWTQTTNDLVSPMSRYTRGWLRDTEGPVRLWLRAGLHEQALATIEAVWRAQLAEGGVQNSFALDLDLDAVELPEDPEEWWAEAGFMEGLEPTEAPSFPVLLHAQAADWTGATWDDQRMAFLEACVERQEVESGLLRFSGDETFRYPMASAVGALPEELGWSANSTFCGARPPQHSG